MVRLLLAEEAWLRRERVEDASRLVDARLVEMLGEEALPFVPRVELAVPILVGLAWRAR